MPTLSPDTIYFVLEYRIINKDTKTICRMPSYSAHWDGDDPKQYLEPTLDLSSPCVVRVRYHIGKKVRPKSEGGYDFADADVLTPCELLLQREGYCIIRLGPGT